MKLWPAAYPETLRHIACVPCLLLPLDSFLVGQVDKFAAVLLDTLAYFQLSEVYVGVLVLDVLGIKGRACPCATFLQYREAHYPF